MHTYFPKPRIPTSGTRSLGSDGKMNIFPGFGAPSDLSLKRNQWYLRDMPRLVCKFEIPRMTRPDVLSKFSKSNIPFVQPSLAYGPLVILPPSQVRQILSMPDRQIHTAEPQQEVVQAPYTICDPNIYENRFHFDVVRRQLSKNLALFTEDIAEELALGFEQYWGTSSEWTTVKAWDSALKIIARAANRVFVGAQLCQ